jgi:GDP-L-fucose synthase
MPVEKTLNRASRIYVAGHRGLAGSAIWRHLAARGFTNLLGAASSDLDLRDRRAVFAFMNERRPDVVIDAAGRVGGIHANNAYPHDFLSDNLQIQVNLLDAANAISVDRLLFLGSSCIYPKQAPQPIRETSLLTGPLEPTNEAYAIAKIAGMIQVQAIRRQHGRRWICAMPTNLYGPGDSFHPEHCHVLPALLRRFHEAKERGSTTVVIWGTGTPRREFLYVDDLADATLFLLENYDAAEPINVGTGEDLSIRDLATLVAGVVGYRGEIVQDPSRPDGTAQKRLDVSRLNDLGWRAQTLLCEGVRATYAWYRRHEASVRGR